MERAPVWVLSSAVLAAVVALGIRGMVADTVLLMWLGWKWLALLPRFIHAWWLRRHEDMPVNRLWRVHYPIVLLGLAFDGFIWGTLLWWLTPVNHVHLGIITLSVLLGVSAIRAFALAVDFSALMAFIAPIILPNLLFIWGRGDILGATVAFSLANFLLLNAIGAAIIQKRSRALLMLRFQSERTAEEKARALDEARVHSETRTRFLATVSHEMRTPLHGILGLTRVLMQESPRADQLARLTLLERSGEHLLTVINDILDFSKIDSGRMTLDEHPFDLNSLVTDVVSVFEVLAQRKGLELSCVLPWQGTHQVVGDAGKVRQVLNNLLGNAVKFTASGLVHVHVSRYEERGYSFEVRDTGAGIPQEHFQTIFEPFTQVHPVAGHHQGGTGLGLPIAREICRSMGGDIQCTSEVGHGTVFTATLHLAPTEAVLPAISVRPAKSERTSLHGDWEDTAPFDDGDSMNAPDELLHGVGGVRVLLVEDNSVNVVVGEAMLHNLGCEVHTVTDGQQALDWLAHNTCDIVLMDCTMPVMDGFEATRLIRQREAESGLARLPIVATSASTLAADLRTCLDAGMDEHLAKPFTPDSLKSVIARTTQRGVTPTSA